MKTVFKIAGVLCICLFGCNDRSSGKSLFAQANDQNKNAIDFQAVKIKAIEAKSYCESKKINLDFFLLADLNRHSGLKRFYIWDFKKDTITDAMLVSHGCGANPWAEDYSKDKAQVSNTDGSHLSSVGKYIIGARGYSNWGINVNYLMHGQEATNSNALKRQIVLHSWEKVPDVETYPAGTPEGWGCPALSNASMRIVDAKLKNSGKGVLLWVVQ